MLLQQLVQMKTLKEGQMKNAIMDTVEDQCRNADIPKGASYEQAVAAIVKSIRNTDSMASECSVAELTDYVKDYFPKDEYVAESADLAKKLVRGEQSGPGILNKLDRWFASAMIPKGKNRFLPPDQAMKQLKLAGFSDEQAQRVRDEAAKAGFAALERMHQKYPEEIVKPKYSAPNKYAFQVADLYLNVGEEIRDEFAELFQKLFDIKMEKIKNVLNIVKEDEYQDPSQQAVPAAEPAPEQTDDKPDPDAPEEIGKAGDYTVSLDKKSETVTLKKGEQSITSMPLVIWSQLKRQ